MENKMKVVRTYNTMFDASYINFEIEGAPQQFKDLDSDGTHNLMMDPKIKALCRQYLMDTLINRVGIIHDYWFDGCEWEEDYCKTSDEVFDMVYGDEKDAQRFLNMVKKDLDERIEFMFNDDVIAGYEANWGISFI